jgi:hypothetical protein
MEGRSMTIDRLDEFMDCGYGDDIPQVNENMKYAMFDDLDTKHLGYLTKIEKEDLLQELFQVLLELYHREMYVRIRAHSLRLKRPKPLTGTDDLDSFPSTMEQVHRFLDRQSHEYKESGLIRLYHGRENNVAVCTSRGKSLFQKLT